MISVLLPAKKIDQNLLLTIASFYAARTEFELLIGLQEEPREISKCLMVEKLSELPAAKIIDSTKCKNLSQNLNTLLLNSQTQYVVRIDSGDMIHPKRLKDIEDFISCSKNNWLILGQGIKDFISGIRIHSRWHYVQGDNNSIKEQLLLSPPFFHPSITINLSNLDEIYDEQFTFAQDYKLYVDNISNGQYCGINSKGTYYSIETTNFLTKKRIKQLSAHDKCMHILWTKIGLDISLEEIRRIRQILVTKEDASDAKFSQNDYNLACESLQKASMLLKEYLS